MAIAVDASSPALVTNLFFTATTASFTPPDDVVLVACAFSSTAQSGTTLSISNNGTALIWTQLEFINSVAGKKGACAIWVAKLPGAHGRTGLTVSTTVGGASSSGVGLKLLVLTGADTATQTGGHTDGSNNSTSFTTTGFTIGRTGSLGVVVAEDNNGGTLGATGTTNFSNHDTSNGTNGIVGYKTLGSAGGSATFSVSSTGTPANNWVTAEIFAKNQSVQNTAGSSTPAGSIAGKQVQKSARTGSTTPGATIAAKTSVKNTQLGSSTPTGAITKAVTKDKRTGSSTPSGTVTPTKVVLLPTRTGSTTSSGTIKPFSAVKNSVKGSSTPSGTVAKAITKAKFTGSTTPTGSAPPAHIVNRPAAGSSAPSGSISKTVIKNATGKGSITPTGVLKPKSVTYLLSSSLAPSGLVVPHRLSATATWLGDPKPIPSGQPVIWSTISWEVTSLPPGSSVTVQTSVNNGATWEDASNGESIPNLVPRTSVAKALNYRILLRKASGTAESPVVDKLNINIDTDKSYDEMVQAGVFLITDTTITDGPDGVQIELEGQDLSLRLQENAWESVRTFPSGTNMGDVIKQVILDRDPSAQFDFASTQMVAPATLTFGANAQNNPLADVQQCAAFCGMELFMDWRGIYVLQPLPDPSIQPSVFTFSDKQRPVMTRVMRKLTRSESFNYIVVSGESSATNPDGTPIVPVSASAADNDPRSPTYYLGTGGKRVKRFVSKLVTSTGDALTMAQGYLLKLKGAGETVEISAVQNPALVEGDIYTVDRQAAGLNANYLLDSFQINFGVDQDVPYAGRRQKLDQSQPTGGGVGGLDGDTGGGSGGTIPRTYSTPGECLKIGTNGNLNHFKVQTGISGGSSIIEKSQAQIGGGYTQSPEFCMTSDNTAVQMRISLDAPTTSGSSNPRTELRQMDTNGTGTTGWPFTSGYGVQVCLRWTKLPNSLKRCSGMQIHDASDDVLQIKTEVVSGTLKYGYNKNGGSFVALGNYTEGDWLTVRIMVTGSSTLNIIHKAGTDPTLAGATTTSVTGVTHSGNGYFKVGTYPQSTGSESSSDYAAAEFKKLGSYYPGGPDPVYDSDTIGGGDTTSFTVAFGACINANASAAGSLTHIKNAGPDYFAILGDFWYKDGATPDWVADWNRQTGYSNFAALIAALPNPIIVGVSDHDFGYANNATGVEKGSTFVNNFNTAYRTKWGSSGPGVQNATLPTTGIYRTWVVGRVRFVLLDMLSFKSSLTATDNSSKTMLGSTQKAWFKNILSTASEPMIVVFGDGQIPGPKEAGQDEWRGYDTERNELASALSASSATVLYLNGDTHSLATGSNQYGYDKVWQSAPLHNTTKVKAGGAGYEQQYPDNAHESDTVVSELYAIVEFTDTGSSITATYKGYEGTEVRITDTIST
jgi:hypothetical protein